MILKVLRFNPEPELSQLRVPVTDITRLICPFSHPLPSQQLSKTSLFSQTLQMGLARLTHGPYVARMRREAGRNRHLPSSTDR